MKSNTPYGFEDPGLTTTRQTKALTTDIKRKTWEESLKDFPQTPQEAEATMYNISSMRNSIDNDNFLRLQKEG